MTGRRVDGSMGRAGSSADVKVKNQGAATVREGDVAMRRSVIETVMGGVTLLAAGLFLFFAWQLVDTRHDAGYRLEARFAAVDGLTPGSEVRIGGVKVGTITDRRIDSELYEAVIGMSIRGDVRIPADSVAAIVNDGLLGARYVRIEPGRAPDALAAGAQMTRTRDAVAFEELLGRLIFLITDDGNE